ncbi:MAG: bifunctional 5,10-methylenetetrahydrofolate dehydrogenase/5,10-methenyltetrahydrofolate cyclohydrolase [Synergistaceae bacterium]|nr:bifunctional 5,10-methylenetetrahydrofolate dehydrogenase/5,10-methenyltetrahydrofolate cyclohydrolase [Synergistaceae bacterium]
MTRILEGKTPAKQIREWIASEISQLSFVPKLAAVQVGSDPASLNYVGSQIKAAQSVGAYAEHIQFDAGIEKERFIKEFKKIAADPDIDAIILMTPLPKGWNADEIRAVIPPEKDIEGVLPENLGRLYLGETDIPLPCTAHAAILLLEYYGMDFAGKRCAVIGRSPNVGRAAALLAQHRNATVAVCHTRTPQDDFDKTLADADVIISAAGQAGIIDLRKLKKSAWLADVGTNFVDGKLTGDVAPCEDDCVEALSPVPGGVGPLTVALLLSNLILLASKRRTGKAIKLDLQKLTK